MLDLKKIFSRFKVNIYFIILLIFCFISGYFWESILLLIFLMFHELCHVLFARIFGLKIKSIEIFPFGGVARIDNLDSIGHFKEIIITVSGPLFNLMAAIVLYFFDKFSISIPYSDYMTRVNITLAFFNLLPGLPLDGGRIFRAILRYFVGFKKATKTAVISGKMIAILLFLSGVFILINGSVNISLLVMPFFIFISAGREEKAWMFAIIKDMINKKIYIKRKGVMETREICVYENTCVSEILKFFDLDRYHIILVINSHMEVEAMLTETEIFDNLSLEGNDLTVGELCRKIKRCDNQ